MAWARLHRSPGTVIGATSRLSTGVEGVKRTVSPTAGGADAGGGCAAGVAGRRRTAARTSISVQLCFRFIPFSWVRFETLRASLGPYTYVGWKTLVSRWFWSAQRRQDQTDEKHGKHGQEPERELLPRVDRDADGDDGRAPEDEGIGRRVQHPAEGSDVVPEQVSQSQPDVECSLVPRDPGPDRLIQESDRGAVRLRGEVVPIGDLAPHHE